MEEQRIATHEQLESALRAQPVARLGDDCRASRNTAR
jgi:hypothetical protein